MLVMERMRKGTGFSKAVTQSHHGWGMPADEAHDVDLKQLAWSATPAFPPFVQPQ